MNYSNRDKWIQEQLRVILHYPDQGNSEYAADPEYGTSMSCNTADICEQKVKLLSNITPRFRAYFTRLVLTLKSSTGNMEVCALLSFVSNKEQFSFIWVQFLFICQYP